MNVGSNYEAHFTKNTELALADIGLRRQRGTPTSKEGNQRELSTTLLPSVASL
jgi:hypothetical protein